MSTYPKEYFYKKIVGAKLFIDQYYFENIDVQNIANEALFSKFDFIRQFKKTYGRTPYNYLKSVRLTRAAALLRSSSLSTKEVCYAVGYDSISSFSGLFKKQFGMPPQRFREEYQERSLLMRNNPLNFVPGCFAESKGWKKSNFEEVK